MRLEFERIIGENRVIVCVPGDKLIGCSIRRMMINENIVSGVLYALLGILGTHESQRYVVFLGIAESFYRERRCYDLFICL